MLKKIDADKALNYLYLLYAFTLPLSRASVSIATALILLLFFLAPSRKKRMLVIWQMPAARWIVLFVAYYFLSLLLSADPNDSWGQWKGGVRNVVPYLNLLPAVIIAVTLKRRMLPLLLYSFLAGMLVSEFLSYLIYFGIWDKKHFLVSPLNPTPFMHHIQYSTFLALTALILLGKVVKERRLNYRLFYLLFFLTVTGTLFLIDGRTGQAAFLVGIFMLAFAQFENRFKALLVSILLVISVVGSAYALSENFRERIAAAEQDVVGMIEKGNYETSLGYRVGVTILSLPLIEKHPVFGVGVIDAMPMVREGAHKHFANDFWLNRANHLQNQYLQVLVETGFVGLAILLIMFYMIAKIPLHLPEYRHLKIVFVGIYLFTMVSDIQLHIQFTAGLFALIVGILLAQSRFECEKEGIVISANSFQGEANG